MKSKYQMEIDGFRDVFLQYQNKKIAIYGIGRRTATLLPGIQDFNIVGLLDRTDETQGTLISGIPVISLAQAEAKADMLIINSDPTNFLTIYRRISHTPLPVYYANGEKAELPLESYRNNSYWNHTQQEAEKEIVRHDVVTFDLFDTLIMRKVLTPTDVFLLLAKRAKEKFYISFDLAKLRQTVVSNIGGRDLSLAEIYENIASQACLDNKIAQQLMQLELDLEADLCVPRDIVVSLFYEAQRLGKEVFIVSDTYFSLDQIMMLISKCGLGDIKSDHIYLSSAIHHYKADGSMWQYFREKYSDQSVLHFGDNIDSDIEQPKRYGIDTFHLMSGHCMLEQSSLSAVLPRALSLSHSVHLGLLIAKIFNNPFTLSKSRGKVTFHDIVTFGYAVFGGVMTRFLMWLYRQAQINKYDRLLFFARDGYFLIRDFEYLQQQVHSHIPTVYIPISRRLIYLATMENDQDFQRVMTFPYVGTFENYLQSRFNIKISKVDKDKYPGIINAAGDFEKLKNMLVPYKEAIWKEAETKRYNYMTLLEEKHVVEDKSHDAVVDFSYYGTNQYYFQKLMKKSFDGYYFSACFATDNEYRTTCIMNACFNRADDPEAKNSFVKKKSAFLESFLTAPYGMIRWIDNFGELVCESDKSNQYHFSIKEKVNDGVLEYMHDYLFIYGISGEDGVTDSLEAFSYYTFLNQKDFVTEEIANGFYFDNDMIGSKEVPLEM